MRTPSRYLGQEPPAGRSDYDLIIVGAGPAGLTAGVYASIQKMRTLLISEGIGGQAVDSSRIKNYMGFDFITGQELVDKFRDQLLKDHFVEHRMGRVTEVRQTEEGYAVGMGGGLRFSGKALLVATGMQRRRLNVPGEERLQRRGVAYTLVHDLARYEGTAVAIVGGGNSALQAALDLSPIARRLYLVSRGELTGDGDDIERVRKLSNLTLLTEFEVTEIEGEERVQGIWVESRTSGHPQNFPVSAVFVAIGFVPNASLVAHLTTCNARGEIVVAADCSTGAAGMFAAGDVTSAFGKRVIIASGEGAKAALAAYQYLAQEKLHSPSQERPVA